MPDQSIFEQYLRGLAPEQIQEALRTLIPVGATREEQIAAISGCGVGTVKSRLYYAKRALRRVLEEAKIYG